jgi:dipeptidyl aminopeptidase/acylaminoacyl peptidase
MITDPFADLDAFLGIPRIGGLWLSPDGQRLVVGMATLDQRKARYSTALWEIDPAGELPARRLTRSARGESGAAFTPSGDLLFVSSRPAPDGGEAVSSLWSQPAGGGDACVVAAPPGGVRGVAVSASGTIVFGSSMLPSATDLAGDKEIRARRKDAGVSAILHEEFPIRYWDHDLGPDRTRLLVAENGGEPRDITGHVGRALDDDCSWDITPDGRTVVATWAVAEPAGSQRHTVVAIDVATGERRTLAGDPDHDYDSPHLSPDGSRVAIGVRKRYTPKDPGDRWLSVVPVAGGRIHALTAEWDRWPHSARWTPGGTALIVVADDHGRSPLWRVDATTGQATRLTQDGAYTDVRVAPDGRWAYALRSSVDSPPAPVRIALDGSGMEPLPSPAETSEVPGRLEEVTTTAIDGTPIRAWMALPHNANSDTPVPLLLSIHGGPVMSVHSWSWRWNPWIAVAQGYAVLLPDFALSTGYGIGFIRRGWGKWGAEPYTDLMSITDAAQDHPEIDASRSAAMGGSFGGYMANWIAGHTDRFDAIVTHASVWNLENSIVIGDIAHEFRRELSPEDAATHSPHQFAGDITSPMLVIHGDKDYRVPIGESLYLWWDLSARSKSADGSSPHKFLYFPDENHWVLAPNHTKIWYATVLAFLAQHLRGETWQRPDLLG